jgi:flagellar basal-body rod modification protein FlgD
MPSSIGDAGGVAAAGLAGSQGLGKQDFLTLLVTQLRYQDPLDPLDAQDFASQLAEFTAMEQQILTNELLQTQIAMSEASMIESQNSVAIGMIGSGIVAQGDTVQITGQDDAAWVAASQATGIRIDIVNTSGEVVASVDSTVGGAGIHRVELGSATQGLEPGHYTFRVEVLGDAEGVQLTPLMSGVVEGVRWGAMGPVVVVGGREVPLINILELSNQEANRS